TISRPSSVAADSIPPRSISSTPVHSLFIDTGVRCAMRAWMACSLVLIVGACAGAQAGSQRKPYAETALQWSVPNAWTPSGEFIGMSHFTAAELNNIHQGAGWGPITFVRGDVASTRPDEVSVNPIDDYTWGAAARSVRDGRCYIVVANFDRTNPKY